MGSSESELNQEWWAKSFSEQKIACFLISRLNIRMRQKFSWLKLGLDQTVQYLHWGASACLYHAIDVVVPHDSTEAMGRWSQTCQTRWYIYRFAPQRCENSINPNNEYFSRSQVSIHHAILCKMPGIGESSCMVGRKALQMGHRSFWPYP